MHDLKTLAELNERAVLSAKHCSKAMVVKPKRVAPATVYAQGKQMKLR